jgi:hypothetical protein
MPAKSAIAPLMVGKRHPTAKRIKRAFAGEPFCDW